MRAAVVSAIGLAALGGVGIGVVVMMGGGHSDTAALGTRADASAPISAKAPAAQAAAASAPAPAAAQGLPEVTGSIAPSPRAAGSERAAPAPVVEACRSDPSLLGVARVVRIDTTDGPGFGFENFKTHDFLQPSEVVLTFDDGPWPRNTPAVLAALAAQCTKGTFFSIGKHALWHPELLRQVAAQGHTIGSHTWSHVDLAKKTTAEAEEEIERGISAVHAALGADFAPFFRFPQLSHPPEIVKYLGQRNIAIFSTDLDSFDFKTKNPTKIVQTVMGKLKKQGKGIILMHDFQTGTAHALPQLLSELKAAGFRVVQLTPRDQIKTLPEYDALIQKETGGSVAPGRPTASVVETIAQ